MKDNRYLYNRDYFVRSKRFKLNPERIREFEDMLVERNPTSVLDVGCGYGVLVNRLNSRGIPAFGVDFSPALKKEFWKDRVLIEGDARNLPFATGVFDIVFSSDFFEHINEEDIEKVRKEMFRVGERVIARVAYKDKLSARQKKLHVTNKPKEWWEDKLEGIELV